MPVNVIRPLVAPSESVKQYQNPLWSKDFPDPFVIAWQGQFYAYATETSGFRFQALESPDMVNWTHKGTVFEVPWSGVHYWAPEVWRHDGQFWFTYSALNPKTNKHDIGVAVSRNPLGPFVHQSVLVVGEKNRVGVIDATIYSEGKDAFLIYSEEDPRRIVLQKLTSDWKAIEGDPIELMRPDRDWERGVTEAPTLIKRRGKYHMLYSGGWYQSNKADACYCVAHAVASKLTGPYVKTARPILEGNGVEVFGPGHQSYLKLPSGEEWVFYHAWDDQNEPRYGSNPSGRTLRMDRLVWDGDIPRRIIPTTTPQPAPRL